MPDPSLRWAALVEFRQYCESAPDELWPFVIKWGSVLNRDIRGCVACCLLEHILEHHFEAFFPRCIETINSGNKRFGYTLAGCYKLGEAEMDKN